MSPAILISRVGLSVGLGLILAASAGASTSSHGGGSPRDGDNVWNLGEEPVEYCVERAPGYPLDQPAVEREVRRALDAWIQFFAKYDLTTAAFADLPGGRAKGLSLDFRLVPRCTEPTRQIVFLFGIETPPVTEALRYADRPFGLAIRGPYDHETHRNGGIVWLRRTPDVSLLRHVLMHELGHVFGMAHDSVAIMAPSVDAAYRPFHSVRLPAIESAVWPFALRPGTTLEYTLDGPGMFADGRGCEPNALLGSLVAPLGFDPAQCHRATLDIGAEGAATLRLMQVPSRRTVALTGSFLYQEGPAPAGPVLHTKRLCAGCGPDGRFVRDHLGKLSHAAPAQGFFTYEGRVYPAVLDGPRGYMLRIFDPERQAWWSTAPYQSMRVLRP